MDRPKIAQNGASARSARAIVEQIWAEKRRAKQLSRNLPFAESRISRIERELEISRAKNPLARGADEILRDNFSRRGDGDVWGERKILKKIFGFESAR